jgi:hypothetical protein
MKQYDPRWETIRDELLTHEALMKNADGGVASPNKLSNLKAILNNTYDAALKDGAPLENKEFVDILLPSLVTTYATSSINEICGVQVATGPRAQIHILRVTKDGRMTIKAAVVEPALRTLSAQWTIEVLEDAIFDIKSEIIAALTHELGTEETLTVISKLKDAANPPTRIFDMFSIPGTPTFVGEVHSALAKQIVQEANDIAIKSRRYEGNWCIVSPTALTILQSGSGYDAESMFVRHDTLFPDTHCCKYIGKINKTINVYVNQYAADNTPVLIGYKGNDIDAAAIHVPYRPMMMHVEKLRATFTALTSLHLHEAIEESPMTSADYLGLVGIETSTLTFI